jgi:hypothetical protein
MQRLKILTLPDSREGARGFLGMMKAAAAKTLGKEVDKWRLFP